MESQVHFSNSCVEKNNWLFTWVSQWTSSFWVSCPFLFQLPISVPVNWGLKTEIAIYIWDYLLLSRTQNMFFLKVQGWGGHYGCFSTLLCLLELHYPPFFCWPSYVCFPTKSYIVHKICIPEFSRKLFDPGFWLKLAFYHHASIIFILFLYCVDVLVCFSRQLHLRLIKKF